MYCYRAISSGTFRCHDQRFKYLFHANECSGSEFGKSKQHNSIPVLVVDMATDFNDSYYADDVHYNESGAQLVAERYFNILQNVLQ